MADRCLNRKELAEKLGKTVKWTYRHLAAQTGFPAAVLPNCWSEAAVDRWMASRSQFISGSPAGGAGSPAQTIQDAEDEWAARLDGNAERMAGA